MLMAAATHTGGGSAHSSSISPPPPWHPVILVPSHHQQQHQVVYDLDLATPSPTTNATASPARHNHNHNHLGPASRRAGKRWRRPSRKLPTTYINADAASFRRMVHQVTGADDDALLLPGGPGLPEPELLCRRANHSRVCQAKTTETLLPPTLDTSAFLLGAAARGGGASPARPGASCCCHGSAVTVVDPGAVLQAEACGGGVFPSLESWDEDDALF